MRILQINNFHYVRGGSDRVYLETSKLLEQAGHEVIYFSSLEEKNIPSEFSNYFTQGIDYTDNSMSFPEKLTAAKRYIFNKEAVSKLELLINDTKPDIAHLHIFQSRLSSAILKVLKKLNVPAIMTVHDYKMLCPVSTFFDGNNAVCEACGGSKYYHAVLRKCNEKSALKSMVSAIECYVRDYQVPYISYIDHFIMVSRFTKNMHVKYDVRFAEKSSVLYNFSDLGSIVPDVYRGKYYLYFGRLNLYKGVVTLVKAFEQMPHLQLKIAGDGPIRAELEKMVAQNAIGNIEFLGFQSGNVLTETIRNASFTFVTSELYENNPMSIIESFAACKPVIGSDIGGTPELITEMYNGFCFEHGQVESLTRAVLKAESLTDETYNELSANARSFAERNFNKEQHLINLLELYRNVIMKNNDRTT